MRPKNKGPGHVVGWVELIDGHAHGYTDVLFGLRTKESRVVPISVNGDTVDRAALYREVQEDYLGQWVSVSGEVYYNEFGLPLLVDYRDMDFAITDPVRRRANKLNPTLH